MKFSLRHSNCGELESRYDSAEITFFGGIKHVNEYIAMRENRSGLTPPQIFPGIM